MMQKGWSRQDAVVSLAAIITQVLIEGGPGGEALAAILEVLVSGLGPDAAAAHLRKMALTIEAPKSPVH